MSSLDNLKSLYKTHLEDMTVFHTFVNSQKKNLPLVALDLHLEAQDLNLQRKISHLLRDFFRFLTCN